MNPGYAQSNEKQRSLRVLIAGAILLLAASIAGAQNLQTLTCPAGTGPHYAKPHVQEFLPGDVGTPLLRATLADPDAVCNDGTPAVMYIRPAYTDLTDYWDNGSAVAPNPLAERWIIWLQGGGGCLDEESCLERWCSASGSATDHAGNMSTLGAYDAIHGTGLLARHPDNHFGEYNHVLINYCSSDSWTGSASHVGLPTSSGVTYDIEFQGEAIVRAAFSALLNGTVGPDPQLGYWTDSLPTLGSAIEILIVGDSAGAVGTIHHLDRLESFLRSRVLASEVDIRGVLDAGVPPGLWRPGVPAVDWPTVSAKTGIGSYSDLLTTVSAPVADFRGVEDTALDQSCLNPLAAAAHVADGGVHPEVCYDAAYVLHNHVQTPFFLAMDIHDPLPAERYADWGVFANRADYYLAQQVDLMSIAGGSAGIQAYPVLPGVFGPRCNEHVRMSSTKFFRQRVTLPGGGVGLNFHDLLFNWIYGTGLWLEIQGDWLGGPAYPLSWCP